MSLFFIQTLPFDYLSWPNEEFILVRQNDEIHRKSELNLMECGMLPIYFCIHTFFITFQGNMSWKVLNGFCSAKTYIYQLLSFRFFLFTKNDFKFVLSITTAFKTLLVTKTL